MNRLLKTLMALSLVITSAMLMATEISQQASESIIVEESIDANQKFGSWLFEGHFKQTNLNGFNDSYRINIGDTLTLQLWGALEVNTDLNVDKQGNVFIPRVGPVKVAGILNKDLNNTVVSKIKTVYKSTVNAYVNLKSSQPVKVFVSGFANKPGLYEGLSSDSILAFIDQAQGIRQNGGSMRFIEIKRNNKLLQKVDLYEFLEKGNLKFIQFKDGDVIHINENNKIVSVKGEVANSYSFELKLNTAPLQSLIKLISPNASATHIRIISTQNSEQITAFYPINELDNLTIQPSDIIEFVADNRVKNISVRVEGEHNSSQEFVLKRGTTLKQLLKQIEWSELSDPSAAQLYRKSVQQRQQQMIEVSANSIQESVLNARSATTDTAKLRQAEAELILKWVAEAKKVQAKGQVILDKNNT
ncbi:MAG: polysaccharide biosynthesis/export family protein, partial [Pseudomonadales bacterium]|nr:polysaccharide biosynthesis/export family protein [Pseudomonadales bacterium]